MISRRVLVWLAAATALGAIGAGGLAIVAATEARHVSSILANGVDAIGRLQGGRRVIWKGTPEYSLRLTWNDQSGKSRRAHNVPISTTTAREIISGEQLLQVAAPIRYLAGDNNSTPILKADGQRRLADLNARIWLFGSLALMGFLVTVGLLAGRRYLRP